MSVTPALSKKLTPASMHRSRSWHASSYVFPSPNSIVPAQLGNECLSVAQGSRLLLGVACLRQFRNSPKHKTGTSSSVLPRRLFGMAVHEIFDDGVCLLAFRRGERYKD